MVSLMVRWRWGGGEEGEGEGEEEGVFSVVVVSGAGEGCFGSWMAIW